MIAVVVVVEIDSVAMTVEMVLHGLGMYAIGVEMVVAWCCEWLW